MSSLEGVTSVHYLPNGSFYSIEAELSDLEISAMYTALAYADEALSDGNPPVGAVLLDRANDREWGASTADKTNKHLVLGHAEVRAYDLAQPKVGDQLEDCTLVTTSQLCTSCAPHFAEGKIGKVVYAASRREIWEATGKTLMRQRRVNMHEALSDGATNTVVVGGYKRAEALAKFMVWAEGQGFPGIPEIEDIEPDNLTRLIPAE